jgi:hypothetical protein
MSQAVCGKFPRHIVVVTSQEAMVFGSTIYNTGLSGSPRAKRDDTNVKYDYITSHHPPFHFDPPSAATFGAGLPTD